MEKVIFDSLVMGRLWCSMNQEKVNGSREPSEEALVRSQTRDFPGGPVVANLPASAGDVGSIPGLGGAHRLWSLCPRAKGLHLLKPECLNPELGDRSHASEKHVHCP